MIGDVLVAVTGESEELVYEDPYSVCEEHFNMDFQDFEKLVGLLLPLCAEGISPLTKEHLRGFAKDSMWLWKVKAKD
jgi:hypothetical protein